MDEYKEDGSLLAHYESQEKWACARRGALVQRVVGTFKNCSVDLMWLSVFFVVQVI